MSRPIKFRAWDEKNKQFADYEDIEECLSCQAMDGWRSSDGIGCCFGINAVEILADCIIEQYTGLKDKNGKEIYEGDIVKISGEIALNDDICVDPIAEIVWVDSAAGFGEKFTVKKAPMIPIGLYKYEVIGNIHENPELLGGEDE